MAHGSGIFGGGSPGGPPPFVGAGQSLELGKIIENAVYKSYFDRLISGKEASLKDDISNLKGPIQKLWDFLTGIKGIQAGYQEAIVRGYEGKGATSGYYFGRDGNWGLEGGEYLTIHEPNGGYFAAGGFTINLYRSTGSNPKGKGNTLNVAIGVGVSLSYDNSLNLESFTVGGKGIAGGFGWTYDTTTVKCRWFCK